MKQRVLVFLFVFSAAIFGLASAGRANHSVPFLTDANGADLSAEEGYKNIITYFHSVRPGNSNLLPWETEALDNVRLWSEFANKYSNSPFVSHAHLHMAEWYLTIHNGDDKLVNDLPGDPNAVKDNPGLLNQVYARLGLKLLTDIINNFPDQDYLEYSYGDFFWSDKVAAQALYLRAMLFRDYCKVDLIRLKNNYPDTPSAKEALRLLKCK